jgi:hypothetical protein
MKYLFFFKGQPLLLYCVCCKIAIQDFFRGLHKKNKKNLPFPRRIYQRTITRRYFTESCKKITRFCHIHWRISDGFSDINTDGITDGLSHACLTRVRQREYRRNCRRLLPTASPIDHACLTRVPLHHFRRHYRRITHVWHVSVCTSTDGISDGFANGSKSLAGFPNFFGVHFN